MYITAQRVRDRAGKEDINAFLYEHGMHLWIAPPREIPDGNPGTLRLETINIAPAHNQVLSYLDIVTPDLSGWELIHQMFIEFLASETDHPLPWNAEAGPCRFRFSLDGMLVTRWRNELAQLYRQTRDLYDRYKIVRHGE